MFGLLIRLVVFASFLIFVGWIVGGLYLNKVIKTGIETMGPKITGTAVTLDRVNLSFVTGRGRLKGLIVGNPKGFYTDKAYHLVDSKITFDPLSVFSGKLVIEEIVIDSPEITYEVNFSSNNLEKIERNVKAFRRKNGLVGEDEFSARSKRLARKLVQINHFIVRNPKLNVSASIFRGRTFTVDLDDIHLRDIGKKSKGVTVDEATSLVLAGTQKFISKRVTKSGRVRGP